MRSLGLLTVGRLDSLVLIVLIVLAYRSFGRDEQQAIVEDFNRANSKRTNAPTTDRRVDEQLFRSIFEHAAGMALVDPAGQWLRVNRALCSALGYSDKELLEKNFSELTHPAEVSGTLIQIEKIVEGGATTYQTEQRIIHKLGHSVWMLLNISAVRDRMGHSSHLVFQFQDITERKTEEARLVHNVFHDALTGLPNRTLFMDRLRLATERSRRRKDQIYAVLFLDLDDFKAINDTRGHTVGDQLLVQISRRLETCLRTTDTIARLSGDEFTILLEDLSSEREMVRIVERIQRELAQPFKLGSSAIQVTASMGVTWNNPKSQLPEEILRDADLAMYRAKARGKACYQLFANQRHTPSAEETNSRNDLDESVDRGDLLPFSKPAEDRRTLLKVV